jgi:hypothetical protein
MAVEWSYIDVGLFRSVPRSDSSLAVVVEVKGMHEPINRVEKSVAG